MRPRVAIADQAGRVIVQRDLARERRAGLLRTEEEGKEVGRGAFFKKGRNYFACACFTVKPPQNGKIPPPLPPLRPLL